MAENITKYVSVDEVKRLQAETDGHRRFIVLVKAYVDLIKAKSGEVAR